MKPLTKKAAKKAIRWYQKRMRLRDWRIRVKIHDDPPGWWDKAEASLSGGMKPTASQFRATVWISNRRCLADKQRPLETLFHECEHIRTCRDGMERWSRSGERKQFSHNCVAAVLADLYRKEKR